MPHRVLRKLRLPGVRARYDHIHFSVLQRADELARGSLADNRVRVEPLVDPELVHQGRPDALLGREHDADAQHVVALLRAVLDGFDVRVQVRQRKLDAFGEFLAVWRERYRVALALQQLGAQLLLELLYGDGKRRLGNKQFGGGFLVALHLRERAEVI